MWLYLYTSFKYMVFKSTWDWFQKCEIHSNCNDISWGKWRWTINVHQCPDKPTCLVGNYDFWWLDNVHLLVSYLSTCWCPSCPLVGYCPLFGFNLQSLGVSSAKKNETVTTAMGYPEPTCLTYCATTKNMVETHHCAATEAHVGPIASSCKTPSIGTSGLAWWLPMVLTHAAHT